MNCPHPTCEQPDRDVPKMKCGYPLPCPHHTITIEGDAHTTTVTIPLQSSGATHHYTKLLDIGDAVTGPRRKRKARRK